MTFKIFIIFSPDNLYFNERVFGSMHSKFHLFHYSGMMPKFVAFAFLGFNQLLDSFKVILMSYYCLTEYSLN